MLRVSPMQQALAPYVSYLCVYDVSGRPGVHIGMPSTSFSLVLQVNEALDVGWAGEPDSRGRFWSNAAGLHTRPAEITHGSRQHGVCVGLTMSGARALLGLPAGEVAGHLADLADIDGQLRDLPERLAETDASRWPAVVGDELTKALVRHDAAPVRREVARALSLLATGAGVSDVAAEVGLGRRQLSELVRAETGVTPQQWRGLARFQRSRPLVAQGLVLAEVAAMCGYSDQSHLTREWVALAGCSPREWRRRELPIVQDRAAAAARD
jgi:AraC-like DNA-binding protein